MNYTTTDIRRSKPLYRGTQIVWYIASIIEIALGLRLVLLLIGAREGAPFTKFIFDVSGPFVRPFSRLVASSPLSPGIFDWNTLIAMLVWWLVALLVVRLLLLGKPVSVIEAHQKLQLEENDTETL